MKLLFLNPTGHLGGAERVLLGILTAVRDLRPQDHLHLLTLTEGPLVDAAQRLGVAVTVFPLPANLGRVGDSQLRQHRSLWRAGCLLSQTLLAAPALWEFVSRLRRWMQRLGPELIHSNGIKTHVLASLAQWKRVPVLWHIHDFYGARPLVRWLLPWWQGRVTSALAISAAVGRDVQQLLPRVPVTVVPNAVDIHTFAPGSQDGAWLDQLAGLPTAAPGVVRLGLVGTYARWKGHAVFLEALGRLRKSHPHLPIRGYVVGGPIYQTLGSQVTREELQTLAQQWQLQEHLGFVDFQAAPAPVYRALDVVVHASTQPEPFGLTIIEAMACGRAVVVSQGGGAVELFTPEKDALGVPPGDAAALAAALTRLVSDANLRQRLGASARQTVLQRHGQERFARQITNLLNRET